MKRFGAVTLVLLAALVSFAAAHETYFGNNKVQYREFECQYVQTNHFDIYFYDNQYSLAKFASQELEHAYDIISGQLRYYARSRIPVFIYNSHNDFQQTNITYDEPTEGTQGFTEVFKKRIVVHFMGSYEDFRHLLHHELTHAVIYDYLYGEFFKAFLTPNRLFSLPLWFAEGYAEYSSNGGWSQRADMMVRDATIHDYLQPLDVMQFLSYSEGYAVIKYIADNYGIDKLGEILSKGKALLTMDRALKSSIGMNSEELYDKFSKEMRKRYWPDIALREEPKDGAKQLTNHEKDGSHYNEKPAFHPKGQMLAMFTDRSGYTEIHLISAIDGKRIARLVKGERSADLESLRWYTSGMSFSPDGDQLVFVSKSKGADAINFFSLKSKDIIRRKKFGLKSIISPAWSPDGGKIIFSALANAQRDLFLYNLADDSLVRLTNDRYDDVNVSWFPDNRRIVFSSDRPHPDSAPLIDTAGFAYGQYNLQEMDITTGAITPIPAGPGQNSEPAVSPDGRRLAFVSNRNGIDNIYVYYVDSARVIAVTNLLTSAESPSWSPDGNMIAYSTFFKAGYDIYVIKDIAPKGDHGALVPTDFVLGKYDTKAEWARTKGEPFSGRERDNLSGQVRLTDPDFPGPAAVRPPAGSEPFPDTSRSGDTAVVVADTVPKPPLPTVPGDSDVYVFKAPKDSSVFEPGGVLTEEDRDSLLVQAPPVDSINADSLDNVLPNGEYRVRSYRTRFTPDIVSGGLQYDSFFGFRGQTVFIFSDYLGDQQILVATDLVNTIDQSNLQFYYLYNKLRVDFSLGLFHTKNYYLPPSDQLFSDRFYGLLGGMSWPRSKFSRLELNAAAVFIDRRNYDNPDLASDNVRVATATLSWIHDTVLWGITGPINGGRYRLSIETTTPISGTSAVDYYAGELDYRNYRSLGHSFSMALKLSGGYSDGPHPKNYYLGGSTNRIGSVSVDDDVYSIQNLYFSRVITPLRGYDYYDLVGTRYAVSNLELHFPFIDYFQMRYPLHLGLSRIVGALFFDMGAAWSEHDGFKGATSRGGNRLLGIKSGFGFGARANLGFLVLRYDMAWQTDFNSVAPHTKHYFSLGADF